jgi:hypothetical protein
MRARQQLLLADLRRQIQGLSGSAERGPSLPFALGAINGRLPTGDLAIGALHEVIKRVARASMPPARPSLQRACSRASTALCCGACDGATSLRRRWRASGSIPITSSMPKPGARTEAEALLPQATSKPHESHLLRPRHWCLRARDYSRRLPCEASNEPYGIGLDGPANSHELDQIKPPLSAFILGDEVLRLAEPLGYLRLGQPRLAALIIQMR